MSETTTGGAPATGTAATTTPADPAPAATEAAPADTPLDTPGKAALAAERKAVAAANKALKAANDRIAAFEAAGQSEAEKLTGRAEQAEAANTALRAKYTDMLKRQSITEAATAANATDAETVVKWLQDEVNLDDNDQVVGLDDALKNLRTRKPQLFRTTPPGAADAAANGGRGAPALNSHRIGSIVAAAVGGTY